MKAATSIRHLQTVVNDLNDDLFSVCRALDMAKKPDEVAQRFVKLTRADARRLIVRMKKLYNL
jgi:hypothetical protein